MKLYKLVRAFSFGIFLTIASSCSSNAQKAKAEPEGTPRQFVFGAYGFGGGFLIELRGGSFWYNAYEGDKKKKRPLKAPTSERWKEFWTTVDTLKVWQWSEQYANTDPNIIVSDGQRWQLKMASDVHSVNASGKNSYPADENPRRPSHPPGQETARYRGFEDAVRKLFGLENLYLAK